MIYASRFLRYGRNAMQGPDVLLLQAKLIAAGYHIAASGIYEQTTAKAVAHLPQLLNLPADGVAGPAIWNPLHLRRGKTAAIRWLSGNFPPPAP